MKTINVLRSSCARALLALLLTPVVAFGSPMAGGIQRPPTAASHGLGSHKYLSWFPDAGSGRLSQAVQTLASSPAVLLLDIDDRLDADLTVPSNIQVVHFGGAQIDLNSHVLTLEGSFLAGQTLLFTGAGTVAFSPGTVSRVLPQWWGANTADSVQKALTAAVACGAELFLPAGNYRFDKTVEHSFDNLGFDGQALSIRGSGPGRTIIDNQTDGDSAFRLKTENTTVNFAWFLTIGGLEIFSSTGTGSHGIEIEDIWMGRISGCYIHHLAGDGIVMRADQNDLGLPKTWRIERSLLVSNGGYGIHLESPNNSELAYNVVMDGLDVELNAAGGIYAGAELSKITNSIFAYNGVDPTSRGGIHIQGVPGYTAYENLIAGNGFEGNQPYDVYADRVANLTIRSNDFSRLLVFGVALPDNFIRLDGSNGADDVRIENNQFSSGVTTPPFTAIVGGQTLRNVLLDNNCFNIVAGDTKHDFAPATKFTRRTFGDTLFANQTLSFSGGNGQEDTWLQRKSPGIIKVTGGVANALQNVFATGNSLVIDCSQGLNVIHTLLEDTSVPPPVNPTDGAILSLIIFQGSASFTIGFDPIFKLAEPFTASSLNFSTIRFVYTGLYWVQLGAAAIDASLF
jgi:hypothetical protein